MVKGAWSLEGNGEGGMVFIKCDDFMVGSALVPSPLCVLQKQSIGFDCIGVLNNAHFRALPWMEAILHFSTVMAGSIFPSYLTSLSRGSSSCSTLAVLWPSLTFGEEGK